VQHLPTLQSWHHRLGHANYHVVYDLAHSGNTTSMPINLSTEPPICDACILGKQTKSSIPKVRVGSRAARKLGIVHVDLMEHPDTVSTSGNKYIMDIIDDFSSYAWSIPLAAKSHAFTALQAWERARELETGLKVGIYRSKWGTQVCLYATMASLMQVTTTVYRAIYLCSKWPCGTTAPYSDGQGLCYAFNLWCPCQLLG